MSEMDNVFYKGKGNVHHRTDHEGPEGNRGIARWGWVVTATPRPLYPWEIPCTHCMGGWVGPRAGLDGCGISHLYQDSIPESSSRYTDKAIPAHQHFS